MFSDSRDKSFRSVSKVDRLDWVETPANIGSSYEQNLTGMFVPVTSGLHRFVISIRV